MTMDIEVRIDSLLEKHGRSFYWLSKETGISYTTLWRLKKGKALGINFATLEKLCYALDCQPGDLLSVGSGHGNSRARTRSAASPNSARTAKSLP
jgi:putative transcriptional regulator